MLHHFAGLKKRRKARLNKHSLGTAKKIRETLSLEGRTWTKS